MNKKSLMISVITIGGIICILVGSIVYYRITVSGNIKGTTSNVVFNVTESTNKSMKEIVLKEGNLVPGDKGSFTLSLDATNSKVDMYVALSIDKGMLPTNLKFYTSSDYKSELYKHYEFMDASNQSKKITIYWYWNPSIEVEEDSNLINGTDVTVTIKLDAVQISEYAMMKNGVSYNDETYEIDMTEFWSNTYRDNIKTINFVNDISNLPTSCTGDSDLCWDVSYSSTQNKKVYAYLIDTGTYGLVAHGDQADFNYEKLYNLYIASEAPIFAPSSCYYMFFDFDNLISIDFNDNFNTSKVTNMSNMFYNCSSLSGLDMNNFNTSKVTNMSRMFSGCIALTSLDLNSFNTSKVTDMSNMFDDCIFLMSLDLSSFNTSNVTDMSDMFAGCRTLTNLDVSNFNTSNVTNMSAMFWDCSSLTTTINIMNADVIYYVGMFNNAATNTGSKITVNYIADASALVDNMIATKAPSSNVIKGVQL